MTIKTTIKTRWHYHYHRHLLLLPPGFNRHHHRQQYLHCYHHHHRYQHRYHSSSTTTTTTATTTRMLNGPIQHPPLHCTCMAPPPPCTRSCRVSERLASVSRADTPTLLLLSFSFCPPASLTTLQPWQLPLLWLQNELSTLQPTRHGLTLICVNKPKLFCTVW